MLRLSLRSFRPSLFVRAGQEASRQSIASDRLARRVVAAAWLASLGLLVAFVLQSVPRVPYLDEVCNVHLLADPLNVPAKYWWMQHNEHRIPMPRMLYVAAFKLAGNDFRGPPLLNVALLAMATGVLLHAVARVRGCYALSDAALPLLIMNVGQWENLMWGFQVQFVSSSVLVLLFLALTIAPGFAASPGRIAMAGVVAVLVPLCGANGLALTPALVCFLLFIAIRNLRSGPRTSGGLVALGYAVAAVTMMALYVRELESSGHHHTTRDWNIVATNAANFLALAFGWAPRALHGPDTSGIAAYALGLLLLLVPTVALLFARLRDPRTRVQAAGIGCDLGAVLSLALGLAYGRGAMGDLLACNRYTTLAMPAAVILYVAWAVLPSPRPGRVVPFLLLLVAVAGLWSNVAGAFTIGGIHRENQGRIEHEIKGGIPATFVVDRHYDPKDRLFHLQAFASLRDLGVKPFTALVPDPLMDETPLQLRVARVEGLDIDDGVYRLNHDGTGHIVLSLPRREHIYGLKLAYEAAGGSGDFINLVSWEPGGSHPPRPGYGIISQLRSTHGAPAAAHIFIDREADSLRIDLSGRGCTLRLHQLSRLTPR